MDLRVRALYNIDSQPEGPRQARQIIAEELSSRLPASVVDDIKLMVSELVTNGIVHGAAAGDAPMVLDLLVNGHVRCRVLDHGPGLAARSGHAAAGGGFGLMVVEQLADRWGMQHSPQQTEVWFERQCA
jgi:anti-sigma regulatory factor (Ser/Thr protein kinase)